MPEETEGGEPRAKFEAAEIGPLESRLNPDQLAQLDEMNARVFGGEAPEPPPAPPVQAPPTSPAPPSEPLPPVPPKAPTAPAPKPPPVIDEFTPPEDDLTAPAAPIPETPSDEFPDPKTLFPDDAIEKLRTEKSKGDIRGLREHYEKAVKTAKEQSLLIEDLKKKGSSSEHDALVEDLKKRNAELSAIVERKALTDHPSFHRDFVQPRLNAIAEAEKALQLGGLPVENLKRALGTSDEVERTAAIDELYDSLSSSRLKQKLSKAIEEIESWDNKTALFLADREGNTAKLEAQRLAQEHENLKRQETYINQTLDQAFDYLGKQSPFFRKSGKPGWEKWDAAVDARREEARQLALRNENPALLCGVIEAGVAVPTIMKAFDRVKAENAELRKENTELRGSRPSINGDRIESQSNGGSPDPNEGLVAAGRRAIREITSGY